MSRIVRAHTVDETIDLPSNLEDAFVLIEEILSRPDYVCGHIISEYDACSLYILVSRKENDKEKTARLIKEQKSRENKKKEKQKAEEALYQQYLKLKAKFE